MAVVSKALAEQCQNAEELKALSASRQVPAILFISHQCAQHGHTSFKFPHYLYPETLEKLSELGFSVSSNPDELDTANGQTNYLISWR